MIHTVIPSQESNVSISLNTYQALLSHSYQITNNIPFYVNVRMICYKRNGSVMQI